MPPESNFQQLLERAKAGDEDATFELFQRYKDPLRRAARTRLLGARLQRFIDSEDILQTVMRSFFSRVTKPDNQWKLDSPESLISLLLTMAKNKVVSKSRKEQSGKGGGGQQPSPTDVMGDPPSPEIPPDELAAIKELAAKCWERIPGDIRGLYKMKFEEKMSWDEIGEQLEESGDACRKRLERSLKAVAAQFPEH